MQHENDKRPFPLRKSKGPGRPLLPAGPAFFSAGAGEELIQVVVQGRIGIVLTHILEAVARGRRGAYAG